MSSPPTPRTTLKRLPERGAYDAATIHAVVDAAPICHVALVVDDQPIVIPTLHGRIDDTLYVHGSPASGLLRAMKRGVDICVCATVLDGLVLARSAFHHSVNYRSVMAFGTARLVDGETEKVAALQAISEHVLPGRWNEARAPTRDEVRSVHVLAMSLEEASAKVRVGPPRDEEDDYDLPVWAGVVPLRIVTGEPVPDPRLPSTVDVPASIQTLDGSYH